jgi:hypothetical protein
VTTEPARPLLADTTEVAEPIPKEAAHSTKSTRAHFAAWEQPQLFIAELRAACGSSVIFDGLADASAVTRARHCRSTDGRHCLRNPPGAALWQTRVRAEELRSWTARLCVAIVGSRTEAELPAGILRSHGLKAAVSADDAGGQYPQMQIDGVHVLVAPSEEASARRLLAATDDLAEPDGGS